MRLRDILTITFRDLPSDAMGSAGRVLRRDGIDASQARAFTSGKPVFAQADADALATGRRIASGHVEFLPVLEGTRLLGLIDASVLKRLCGPVTSKDAG